jgi:hypothetical protein
LGGEERRLQSKREARWRRDGLDRPRNRRRVRGFRRANNQSRSRRNRGRHQHKRYRCDQGPLRILTARHRAIHHSPRVVLAIHMRMLPRRRNLLVMMVLRNRAVVSVTASHRVGAPTRSRQWRVQKHNREKTHPRSKYPSGVLSNRRHAFLLAPIGPHLAYDAS